MEVPMIRIRTTKGADVATYPAVRERSLGWRCWAAWMLVIFWAGSASGLQMFEYGSPKNAERPFRSQTDFIILHTTEAPDASSLRKLSAYGEAHYFVDTRGRVFRVVDRRRVALHTGRSMWNGTVDIDSYSIGIEVAGYHNKNITRSQYDAVTELLEHLQRIYQVPDDRVLTHSMVAYGAPNRWHRRAHRGRKRCGMIFAIQAVRRGLGLDSEPAYDPDIRAGRLVVADPYLQQVLYGNRTQQEKAAKVISSPEADVVSATRSPWTIAGEKYDTADATYILPNGTKLTGNQVSDWSAIPVGTRVVVTGACVGNEAETVKLIGRDGANAAEVAGDEYAAATTIYFLPDGRIKQGNQLTAVELQALPRGTQVLVGYVRGGFITSGRSAYEIAGPAWNSVATYYLMPDGNLRAGNGLNERNIPKRTQVFYRR